MFDKDTFEQARVEYGQLSPEDKAAFITSLEPNYQTDWITAFKAFLEDGDYARFESQTGIAALPVGQVHEPGMTREEGYQRDASDIAESSGDDYTPIKDLVKDMGDQYLIATPEVQEQYIKKITAAKGASFAENVAMCFSDRDFCEYIAQETQNYYDALAKNFAEAKSKSQFITKLGEFSEQKDLGGAVMEYITTGIPKEFSVLESVGMLTGLVRRSFSETGTLASAIEDLGEGEVTSDAAETVAENLIDKIDDDIVDAVIAAGAKTEDDNSKSDGQFSVDPGAGFYPSPNGPVSPNFVEKMLSAVKSGIHNTAEFAKNNAAEIGIGAGGVGAGILTTAIIQALRKQNKDKKTKSFAVDPGAGIGSVSPTAGVSPDTENAIAEAVKSVWGTSKEFVTETAGKVGKYATETAEKVGKYATETAGKAGDFIGANKLAIGVGAGGIGAGLLTGAIIQALRNQNQKKASKVANMSEDDKEESVVREANQGNELMDALVEKFKALQTDEARTAMKEQLTSLLGEDVASYIIKRASGQDFEEVNPDDAAKDSVEGETPISETNPKNPQDVKLGGDIDKFEELSKNLMGEDVYAVPEAAPIRQAVVSAAPAAVAALPEGAPVAVANTGTTMEEGYQRDCALDDYANAGLLE